MYTIYGIKKEGKILYIGKTKNLKRRKKEHIYKRDLDQSYVFVEIKTNLSKEDAKALEEKFIEEYNTLNNGWNKTGGEGSFKVKTHEGDGRFVKGNKIHELRNKKRVIHLETGKEYNSAKECAEFLNIEDYSHINKVCSGRRKSYKGMHFEYI